MTGPAFVLVWCTASEGIKNAYYSNTEEGRALLKKDLGSLSGTLVYFVRIYREDTAAIVDSFSPLQA